MNDPLDTAESVHADSEQRPIDRAWESVVAHYISLIRSRQPFADPIRESNKRALAEARHRLGVE